METLNITYKNTKKNPIGISFIINTLVYPNVSRKREHFI